MIPSTQEWSLAAIESIFGTTLDPSKASSSRIFLADLAEELTAENGGNVPTSTPGIADRLLLARLSLDAEHDAMSDDSHRLRALADLPKGQTSFDYLVGAWKRCKSEEGKLRKIFSQGSAEPQSTLENIRSLLVSYLGLILQTPDMFPNDSKPSTSYLRHRTISPLCLVPSLVRQSGTSLASSMDPYSSTQADNTISGGNVNRWAIFEPHEVPLILDDLAKRFDGEGLDEILGPALADISRQIRDGIDDGTKQSLNQSNSSTMASSSSSTPPANGAPTSASTVNEALNAAAAAGDVQAVLTHLLGQAGAANMPGPGRATTHTQRTPTAPLSQTKEGLNIGTMDWTTYVNGITDCTNVKSIAAMTTRLAAFNPKDIIGPSLERDSLFGPVLRLSTFSDAFPSISQEFYSDPKNRAAMSSAHSTLRSTLHSIHNIHFKLFNNLIRSAGGESREAVLAYWGNACELNKKRGAMRVKAKEVASDGFMVNLFEVVMRFCEPFMDYKYTKIDRIDTEYLRRQKRFSIDDLTRLNASESEAKQWSEEAGEATTPPSFITECFYLALRLVNLGPGKAIRALNEKTEELRRLKKRVTEVEQDRASWSAAPQAAQYEAFLKRAKAEVSKVESQLLSSECQLLDEDFVNRLVVFLSFVMTWLVRVADEGGSHPQKQVDLPLKKEVSLHFRMLPEHIFEDVCEILLFLGRYKPDCLSEAAKTDLVTFCTTFLSSGWLITNPFLKAKLAEILFYNVLPFGHSTTGVVGDLINYHPLALKHLVPALMSFWIEAESTGSHTQFYDKFNIRYHLSRVFKTIWGNAQHKERLNAVASADDGRFVIFVNRLLNDVTFLLDDALEKLVELHGKQVEMETPSYQTKSAEERGEFEGHLRSLEGQISNMLEFGNEFLQRLIDFTGEEGNTKDAFMQGEIVGRLTSMLNFNLDLLVGSKCQELKVKDPKKVGFQPRELLKKILKVYLNLAKKEEFIKAIASDGRSYRKETFEKAVRISNKFMLFGGPELDVITNLVKEVEKVKLLEAEEEEELGEVPDEFLDPLMATLMIEPVLLPSSKAILDLSTIKAHLLSDPTDPFNRAPLKIQDVVPAVELKAAIEAFRLERKRARQ
ncbi:hypothetical protein CBS101457_006144 [Exobasidium rhododendri]|nr:hypothetical protein CBS101457_006144 [Exobasidium rhododendri]